MTIHDLKPGRLLPGQVTPAAFWEAITGEAAPEITTTDELRDRLDAAGWEVVWDYCLEDIDEAAANNYLLVLVQGSDDARLYEIPEDYADRFTEEVTSE